MLEHSGQVPVNHSPVRVRFIFEVYPKSYPKSIKFFLVKSISSWGSTMSEEEEDRDLPEIEEIYDDFEATEKDGVFRARSIADRPVNILEYAKRVADDMREKAKEPEQESLPLVLSPLPTDLVRASPFYPLAKQNLGERETLHNKLITSSEKYGKLFYSGDVLSTYEEDCLLSLLAAASIPFYLSKKRKSSPQMINHFYRGPMLPLLMLAGYKKPSKREYKRFWNSVDLLAGSKIRLVRRDKTHETEDIFHIVTFAHRSRSLKGGRGEDCFIEIDPFFFKVFAERRITYLDLVKRHSIKSPLGKKLYGFIESHRLMVPWNYRELAKILNMDLSQPSYQIRRLLRRAICELKGKGFLDAKSGFKKNTVNFVRLTGKSAEVVEKKFEKAAEIRIRSLVSAIAENKQMPPITTAQELEERKRKMKANFEEWRKQNLSSR